MISHLGAMLPVACGLALAAQLRGRAARRGGLHRRRRHERGRLPRGAEPRGRLEAAGALRDREQPVGPLDARARAVRLPRPRRPRRRLRHAGRGGRRQRRARRARARCARPRQRARRGEGPTLLEFKTFRMRGHEEASRHRLRPEGAARASGRRRTRSQRFEELLRRARGLLEPADCATIRAAYKARIDALADEALGSARAAVDAPRRSSPTSSRRACSCRRPPTPPQEPRRRELRYVDAISDALRVAMRRDERIVLLGQDIAEYGGVFKVTEGFVEEFGKARVRNTPIIESGAIGCALGPGARRLRADGGAAVRRLHHLRLQPDRQQPGEDALALGSARAGRAAGAGRRRHRRRPVPLAERRVLVHVGRRPQGAGARDARTTPRACCSRRSRTATRCSTSSTSCSTARRAARVPEGHYTLPIGEAARRPRGHATPRS